MHFRFVYSEDSVNDNYLLTISDSVVAGAEIFRVAAKDDDSGAFGQISYELAQSNSKDIMKLFKINPKSGSIFTLEGMKELDQR